MKPTTLALVLSIAVGASCLVSTRSDNLTCSKQADCQTPRLCESGYCVIDTNACPAVCNGGCTGDTCMITGSGGDDIACPSGKTCVITCSGDACHDIDCTDSDTCTINCVGDNACHNITCGAGDCIITCNGNSACHDVTCGTFSGGGRQGRCRTTCSGTNGCNDVTCTDTCDCVIDGCTSQGDCGVLACPKSGGSYCTGTGANGVPCTDTNSGCSC